MCIKQIDAIIGLKELDDKTQDIVLADPPYNIGKNFGNNQDNLPLDEYIDWSFQWINEATRVLKDSGTMYIYGFPEIISHISTKLTLDHRWLIWHYKNKTVPHFNFWQRTFEVVLCCWKDEKQRIFNRDAVREPYTETFLKNAAGKVRKSTKGRFSQGDKSTIYVAHKQGALPRDLIEIAALAGGAGKKERWFLCKTCNDAFPNSKKEKHKDHLLIEHPTQKPYKLTERLLKAAKTEDCKLLIPFVGTGSECAVAQDLNINYLGFEINPDYIQLAKLFLEKRFKPKYDWD